MSPPPFRVTVVDDHALFADALVIALRGESVDARSVVPQVPTTTFPMLGRAVLDTRPHLVILDLDLGLAGDTMQLLSALARTGLSVIVVTGTANRAHRGEALAKGAQGVLSKSVPFPKIVQAVDCARQGLPVMSRADHMALLQDYRGVAESQRELRNKFNQMTRREAEVLGQLMIGRQVSEIARTRFVSESTVRTQVKAILAKLQVSSQLTAVGLAHELGWQPPTDDEECGGSSARRRRRTGAASGRPGWPATG
jgi:two-component system nitrate/nitrite response regulator NarL